MPIPTAKISTLGFISLILSCSSGEAFKTGKSETKPPRQLGAIDPSSSEVAAKPILAADYNVSVDASNGQNLCKGVANVILGGDLKFKPTGTLKCIVVGDKKIEELFKDTTEEDKLDPAKYPEAGRVTRKPNPIPGTPGAAFDPPRPSLLGPLIQRPEEFQGYRYVEQSRLTLINESGTVQDQGAFLIQVLDVGSSITPEGSGKTYDQIIHWEISASGFSNVQKGAIGVFDRAEYWQNVRPISIPQIKFYSKLSQLFAGGMSQLGDAFLGPVTISITLKSEQRF
jgi:hypothetical protein